MFLTRKFITRQIPVGAPPSTLTSALPSATTPAAHRRSAFLPLSLKPIAAIMFVFGLTLLHLVTGSQSTLVYANESKADISLPQGASANQNNAICTDTAGVYVICMYDSPSFDFSTGPSLYPAATDTGRWMNLHAAAASADPTDHWGNRVSSVINNSAQWVILLDIEAGEPSMTIPLAPSADIPNFNIWVDPSGTGYDNRLDYYYVCPGTTQCSPGFPPPISANNNGCSAGNLCLYSGNNYVSAERASAYTFAPASIDALVGYWHPLHSATPTWGNIVSSGINNSGHAILLLDHEYGRATSTISFAPGAIPAMSIYAMGDNAIDFVYVCPGATTCTPSYDPVPAGDPPTAVPPTLVPPTDIPPTPSPPTPIPPTPVPPTPVPPTPVPPTPIPPTPIPPTPIPPTPIPPTPIPSTPTAVPPTAVPPTLVPPTLVPPTDVPPTDVPPTDVPPTDVPPTEIPPTDIPPTEIPPTPTAVETPPMPSPTAVPPNNGPGEPNGSCGFANTLQADGLPNRFAFEVAEDEDWITFDAVAGQEYRLDVVLPDGTNVKTDVYAEFHSDCDADPFELRDQTFSPGLTFTFPASATGPIYVRFVNIPSNLGGDDFVYTVSVSPLKAVSQGALILVGGRVRRYDALQTNINNVTQNVYNLFRERGYSDDNIAYLSTNPDLPGRDKSSTLKNLQYYVEEWAETKVGSSGKLVIYMMDHGDENQFYLDKQKDQILTPDQLDGWLSTLEEKVPGLETTIIIEACNAGSFIEGDASISKPGRLAITSTNAENVAYASNKGAFFSDFFLTALAQDYSLYSSFNIARSAINEMNDSGELFWEQEPWIDSDGDGKANTLDDPVAASLKFLFEPSAGSASAQNIAARRSTQISREADGNLPPFLSSEPATISTLSEDILLQVNVIDDAKISRVRAVIYPPSYVKPTTSDELVPEITDPVREVDLTLTRGRSYAAALTGLTETGDYQVIVHAEDEAGLKASPRTLTIAVNGPTTTATETKTELYLPAVLQ